MAELFFFLVIAFNGEVSRVEGFHSFDACESYRAKVWLREGSRSERCRSRQTKIGWYYLLEQPPDPSARWTPIGGYPTDVKCYQERAVYLLTAPRSVPTCLGVPGKVAWIEQMLDRTSRFKGELRIR